MHSANWKFWQWVGRKYRSRFEDSVVVEAGSLRIRTQNSLGDLFRPLARTYTGVDWLPRHVRDDRHEEQVKAGLSTNVDVVSVFHEALIQSGSVDVVLSSSMVEHDAYWKETFQKIVDILVPDGTLFLSWGSALCQVHGRPLDPSGKDGYYPRPAEQIVGRLVELGLWVELFKYEANFFGKVPGITQRDVRLSPGRGFGYVVLIASKEQPEGIPEIDTFLEVDRFRCV